MKHLPPFMLKHAAWTAVKVVTLGAFIALDREGYPRPIGWLLRRNDDVHVR